MNGLDVTTTQYTVLVAAGEKDGLSQQDIINATGIDRSTVSQVVQLLIRKGLLKRRRTRHDARAYAVSLTDAGNDVLKASEPIVGRIEEALVEALPATRAKVFIANLRDHRRRSRAGQAVAALRLPYASAPRAAAALTLTRACGPIECAALQHGSSNRDGRQPHAAEVLRPLAIGAPEPYRALPVRLERMIHFVPPHNEKIRSKIKDIAGQVDVVLGNLEDAIPADQKEAARAGFIAMARDNDFGSTGLWTRINCLNSPWMLDDVREIVAAVGDKLDVIMLPKVEGPWDIHYLDQLLAQLEAKHGVKKPILIHAILETAEGVNNVEAIAAASPRMHGMSLGPADLAASRGMKTTRVGGGHPDYGVLADGSGDSGAKRAFYQQDLWHYTVGKMVDACLAYGLKPFYGPFGDFSDAGRLRGAVPQRLPAGLPRRLVAAPDADRHRQARVLAGRQGGRLRQAHPRSDARRHRRRHDRRQDAGRRHLEAGQGDRRSRPHRRRQGSRKGRRLRL